MSKRESAISFTDQTVVITGAGRGLGRGYAMEFARRGACVVVNDIRDGGAAAEAVVHEIEKLGGIAVASSDSVATAEGGRALIDLGQATFGHGISAVIHNAGMSFSAPFDEADDAHMDLLLDVHLRGAFFVLRPAWSIMREQGYGRIVLTSSSAGAFGRESGTIYGAAKAGLIGLSRALAHEGEKHGIISNCVLPYADTGILNDNPLIGAGMTARIMGALSRLRKHGLTIESVVPLVTFMASNACIEGGRAYWACAGRYAEVFTGLTDGWSSGRVEGVSAEEVAHHLVEIQDRKTFTTPHSIADELEAEIVKLLERK